ncbi:unnamed protein product [Linum trigynum]|uniref:non-specific serine/threonine protein kinase n=1 Tax=Linum trigynum TaxID=586398 RepID=A0AAV2EMB2_9ROSI
MGDSGSCDDGLVVEKDPSGRYVRYDEILGRGAFKTVYKAFDEADGIEVAWNQMSIEDALQTPEQLERLYSEVHLLKSLKHENILKSYHSWVDDKNRTINMITELFTSGSLRQYRKKHKNVELKAIKNWARQILRGLHYLHSQSPPIIHRDLKCDNVFVNGNNGQVKIGDLGLATIMQQPTARSVIGTPEFMAPELYDEEYTELVDIYSFGLCMLEMVTCEYPYCECRNPAQIYKKVSSGVKPASLAKVDNPQVKEFIEKCLVPAPARLPAIELLKDPFLAASVSTKEAVIPSDSLELSSLILGQGNSLQSESFPMEIDINSKKSSSKTSCIESMNEAMQLSPLEVERCTETTGFRLRGEKNDKNTISMTLRIADSYGRARNIHFSYFLDSDTTLTIAEEMVEQLELPSEDVAVIAELIDSLIMKLHGADMVQQNGSFGSNNTQLLFDKDQEEGRATTIISDISSSEFYLTTVSSSDDFISNNQQQPVMLSSSPDYYGLGQDASEEIISSDCIGVNNNNNMSCLSSICSLSLGEEDKQQQEGDELQLELAAIDMQYSMLFQELSRMREEAMENAKMKWMAKKKVASVM